MVSVVEGAEMTPTDFIIQCSLDDANVELLSSMDKLSEVSKFMRRINESIFTVETEDGASQYVGQ